MNAQQALNEVFTAKLKGNGSNLWGVNVQPLEIASSTLVKPYVVFFYAGGGRDLITPNRKNARLMISVKGVSLNGDTALAMDDAISVLLDDSGRRDTNPSLPVHAVWDILNVTEGRQIWLEEKFDGAQSIYHCGHQYEVVMEHK